MIIFQADPTFDKMVNTLSACHEELADRIIKIQQDAGVQHERDMPHYNPQRGLETAMLDKAYEEVTTDRLYTLLQEACDVFPEGDLKLSTVSLIGELAEADISSEPVTVISATAPSPVK